MREYIIWNKKDDEHYVINFKHGADCRHWVINHLDLSKEWSYKIKDVK